MGGEKKRFDFYALFESGSPPHGRGKVALHDALHDVAGITPAWAGKRAISAALACSFWDHPRMGGEKLVKASAELNSQGSPPHGRGKD